MSNILLAYFSATGRTKRLAQKIAQLGGFDIFEITPKDAYTNADLNWNDPNSRTSLERNENARVELSNSSAQFDINAYNTILLGFPMWWYGPPKIIHSFLELHDLHGKKISLICNVGRKRFWAIVRKITLFGKRCSYEFRNNQPIF